MAAADVDILPAGGVSYPSLERREKQEKQSSNVLVPDKVEQSFLPGNTYARKKYSAPAPTVTDDHDEDNGGFMTSDGKPLRQDDDGRFYHTNDKGERVYEDEESGEDVIAIEAESSEGPQQKGPRWRSEEEESPARRELLREGRLNALNEPIRAPAVPKDVASYHEEICEAFRDACAAGRTPQNRSRVQEANEKIKLSNQKNGRKESDFVVPDEDVYASLEGLHDLTYAAAQNIPGETEEDRQKRLVTTALRVMHIARILAAVGLSYRSLLHETTQNMIKDCINQGFQVLDADTKVRLQTVLAEDFLRPTTTQKKLANEASHSLVDYFRRVEENKSTTNSVARLKEINGAIWNANKRAEIPPDDHLLPLESLEQVSKTAEYIPDAARTEWVKGEAKAFLQLLRSGGWYELVHEIELISSPEGGKSINVNEQASKAGQPPVSGLYQQPGTMQGDSPLEVKDGNVHHMRDSVAPPQNPAMLKAGPVPLIRAQGTRSSSRASGNNRGQQSEQLVSSRQRTSAPQTRPTGLQSPSVPGSGLKPAPRTRPVPVRGTRSMATANSASRPDSGEDVSSSFTDLPTGPQIARVHAGGLTSYGKVIFVQPVGRGYRIAFNSGSELWPIYSMRAGSWFPRMDRESLAQESDHLPKNADKNRPTGDMDKVTDIMESVDANVTRFRVTWRTQPLVTYPTRSELIAILGRRAVDGPRGHREELRDRHSQAVQRIQKCRSEDLHPEYKLHRTIQEEEKTFFPWIFGAESIIHSKDEIDNESNSSMDTGE